MLQTASGAARKSHGNLATGKAKVPRLKISILSQNAQNGYDSF